MCVCVCVRACVRVCVCVRARARVRVCVCALVTMPPHGVGEGALKEIIIFGQQLLHYVTQTCSVCVLKGMW